MGKNFVFMPGTYYRIYQVHRAKNLFEVKLMCVEVKGEGLESKKFLYPIVGLEKSIKNELKY